MKIAWLLSLFCLFSAVGVAVAADATYHVGPGDALEISVWGHETLRREITVPPDGVISFPLVKDIDINGMTVSAVREAVTAKLGPFVPDATVTVILLATKSLTAFVIGKVNRPGPYPIELQTNVMQMLSMAGGFTAFASPDKVFVLRQTDGKSEKIPFEYNQVVNGKNLDQNILLQRGDVVVVP